MGSGDRLISEMGQTRTSERAGAMSTLPPTADILMLLRHVRLVP
jgi:hypothetical protein